MLVLFSDCLKVAVPLLASLPLVCSPVMAAPTYESGTVNDITSGTNGLYFRFSLEALPGLCTGSIGNWYRIGKVNQAMIAFALSFYMAGVRGTDAYTNGFTTDGYCNVIAFDPA